jgi:hypothetical protein
MKNSLLPLFRILIILSPSLASAQWQLNGTVVCDEGGSQSLPAIVTDGAGGAIVVWEDWRSGDHSDIYAQRLDAGGIALWSPSDVPICTAANLQSYPTLVSDGSGGAVIAWEDERDNWHKIYAQRVDQSGNRLWATDGVLVGTATGNQVWPRIATDGSGGVIVGWIDSRVSNNLDIYVQRLNALGDRVWISTGVAVCTAANYQIAPHLCADGNGGVLIGWMDERAGSGNDIYVQRVNDLGVPLWTADGVALCTSAGNDQLPQVVSDGAGGAIVAWYSLAAQVDVYAGRVDAAGSVPWTANGVVVCNAANNQQQARLVADGAGGAIVTWEDGRSGSSYDVYAQRLSSSGVAQWTPNGAAISTATNNQTEPRIVSDGAGGAIIAWDHARPNDHDIYAQWVDATGVPQWLADGLSISNTSTAQQTQPVVTADGYGGAIFAWQNYDYFTSETDIYALRHPVTPTTVGRTFPPLSLQVRPNVPNPFSASTRLDVYLRDAAEVAVDLHDVTGRRVRHFSFFSEGQGWQQVHIDGHDAAGRRLANGVYFCRVSAAGETSTRKIIIAR